MSRRDDFHKAIKGETPLAPLYHLSLCDAKKKQLQDLRQVEDYISYYNLPFVHIPILTSTAPIDFSSYFQGLQSPDFIDEYGVGHIQGSMEHFSKMISPMQNFDTPSQVQEFPLPDILASYRWEGYAQKVALAKSQDKITMAGTVDIFERSWYLRGLENMLMDFITDEAMAMACLERTFKLRLEQAKRFAAMGIDIIVFGDDVGTERGMMMAPNIWRKLIKPLLKECIAAAKSANPHVLIYYHSDGNIEEIIPELIEVGIDILNPVQPECMDHKKIYEMYHHDISFFGMVGTQTTMPFGSSEDVRVFVTDLLNMSGGGRRLIIAPTHLIEPEVPLENLDAFVQTVQQWNNI